MTTRRGGYHRTVFINCPFDADYLSIFEAIVFTIHIAGFRARSAREHLDSSEIRIEKILELIAASRFSIHDLSRTTLDPVNALPRFNMPLELGIDLGCKAYHPKRANKSILIFDSEQYRFQKFVSDLGGQDIHQHGDDPRLAVTRVRSWLRAESGHPDIPGGAAIYSHYEQFRRELPDVYAKLKLDESEITFADFSLAVARWVDTRGTA
ncbi:MAG TPA: hypothetical protein VEK57_08390 [Thermoanaerobaculia bacterium]|nr:hypothetical protein [Thermoanaerobaculia bacterium]